MKFLDRNDPFFRKTWVRVVCVVLPLAWAGFELSMQSPGWAVMFAALGIYAAFELFFRAAD